MGIRNNATTNKGRYSYRLLSTIFKKLSNYIRFSCSSGRRRIKNMGRAWLLLPCSEFTYSRKRCSHSFDGKVPNDPSLLGDLKGIGPYTRGAILSIAFGQPEPAVDGNVMRVLSRVLYIEDNVSDQKVRKRFEEIVRELIHDADPSAFNQGLMELGALICTPRKPLCLHCPVNTMCRAHEVGETDRLPIKLKKKKQRIENYTVLVIQDENGHVAIEKRPDKGLLANMW